MAQRQFEGLSAEEELDIKDRAMDEAPIGITLSDPDEEDNPMVYINEAFEELTGYDADEVIGRNCRFLQGPATDPDAPGRMREAIDASEEVSVEVLNYRRNGEPFWNEVTIAPVTDDEGELSHFVGFQKDITARKQAERALERERERLDSLVTRIEGFVADVTADVIEAEDRAAVERVLSERIAAVAPYVAVRVLERRSDGSYAVTAIENDAVTDPGTGRVSSNEHLEQAHEADSPVTVDADTWRSAEGDTDWLDDGATQVAVVPITYGSVEYGLMTVAAAEEVNGREMAVLGALARAGATAINAIERGRMLTASTAHELQFAIPAPAPPLPLPALAEASGGDCRVAEFVRREDGSVSLLVTTESPLDDIDAVLEGFDAVEGTELRSDGDGAVYEIRLEHRWIFDDVSQRAGEVSGLTADGDTATLTLRAPHREAARDLRDYVVERFPDADLVGSNEVEREPEAGVEADGPLSELTAKQREALQKAYYGGYFDRPRAVTGDDLAATMDISRATFNQHLRTAERKVLADVFDDAGDRS